MSLTDSCVQLTAVSSAVPGPLVILKTAQLTNVHCPFNPELLGHARAPVNVTKR